MSEKYREIMEKVVVTEEMRQRILQNIRSAELESAGRVPKAKIIRFRRWQKYAAAAACFAMLLIGAMAVQNIYRTSQGKPAVSATGGYDQATGESDQATGESYQAIGAPESAECGSAAELSETIGFPVSDLATLPFEPTASTYSSLFGEIAEIEYTGADGQSATYRKSIGTDDNSGVYEDFADTQQVTAGAVKATVKGDGKQYTLAVWTDGTYAYSIVLTEGVGIDEWSRILQGIS